MKSQLFQFLYPILYIIIDSFLSSEFYFLGKTEFSWLRKLN